jgi:hypothetical protein
MCESLGKGIVTGVETDPSRKDRPMPKVSSDREAAIVAAVR